MILLQLSHSPWIVATRVRRCAAFLNSQRYIPCHVPIANFPPEIGIETLDPANTALICAGYNQPREKAGWGWDHIITSLCVVSIMGVFGGEFVERIDHILPDICIPVSSVNPSARAVGLLVDGEGGGGMLDEQVQ